MIKNFTTKHSGLYQCQVTRNSTNEKIFSKPAEIQISKCSEYDLKLALIVGNSNYESDDEEIKQCKKCSKVI